MLALEVLAEMCKEFQTQGGDTVGNASTPAIPARDREQFESARAMKVLTGALAVFFEHV